MLSGWESLTVPGWDTNPSRVSSQQTLVLIYLPGGDGKLSWLRRKRRLHKDSNLGRAGIKPGTFWLEGRDLTKHAHQPWSCETQNLLLLIEKLVTKTLDNRQQVYLILTDFSKAFDKVPHYRLLLKLKNYGIQGPILDRFFYKYFSSSNKQVEQKKKKKKKKKKLKKIIKKKIKKKYKTLQHKQL